MKKPEEIIEVIARTIYDLHNECSITTYYRQLSKRKTINEYGVSINDVRNTKIT